MSVAYGQTLVAPLGSEDSFDVVNVGGSYDFGVVKATAYYAQSEFASQKLATYAFGALMPLGQGVLKAVVTHANASGSNAAGASVDANDADQVALGYVYNLSKRTAVYGTAAYVKNKGTASFAVASTPAMVAGEKSSGVEFGLRHSF